MFENTSQKLRICSYIYCIGNIINICVRRINVLVQLDFAPRFLKNGILELGTNILLVMIISLVIYGFSMIVKYFE